MLLLVSADFFQKNLPGTLSECQTVWVQIRIDDLSGLIWVQSVCKGYQQTTEVAIGSTPQYLKNPFSCSTEYRSR